MRDMLKSHKDKDEVKEEKKEEDSIIADIISACCPHNLANKRCKDMNAKGESSFVLIMRR